MIFEKKSSLGDRTKVQSTPSAVARGDGALEGVEKPKKWPKKSANALSDALLMSRFPNFAADAAKKTALRAVFLDPPLGIGRTPMYAFLSKGSLPRKLRGYPFSTPRTSRRSVLKTCNGNSLPGGMKFLLFQNFQYPNSTPILKRKPQFVFQNSITVTANR